MKNIIFTGGGSGGHLYPALAIIHRLQENQQMGLYYVGSHSGIESRVIPSEGIDYKAVSTGKLRRYLSLDNIFDLFKIGLGLVQSLLYMLKFSPRETVVFSTGGFVSVPVVIAAKLTGKKVFIHEQTSRVGLANKIASHFADIIFISFEASKDFFPLEKVIFAGYPLRADILNTTIKDVLIGGVNLTSLNKPLLFVTGGGNGSKLINELILSNLDKLSKRYFIIHQVGKNHIEQFKSLQNENYIPVELLGDEIIDLYKKSAVVISRSGAGTVSELIALGIPSIFIPLKIAQKNEQYHNAFEAKEKLDSIIIEEGQLSSIDILETCSEIEKKKRVSTEAIDATQTILDHLV